jgi:hypothetical protein
MRNSSITKKQMTPDALAKLAKAREAMQGMSPRARGAEKSRLALNWIYVWGWSSSAILDLVTDGKRTGLSARLVRQKLIASTKTESGGGVAGIPVNMLTLTSVGLDEVERLREDLLNYEIDPYRIDQSKLRHDYLAQRATVTSLKNQTILDFKTPHELAAKSAKGVKQPDVLWIRPDKIRMGIEVELSAKWDRKLDEFVLRCLQSLQKNQTNPMPNEVDEIAVVSDSKAIVKRYSKAFTAGEDLTIWGKNERGFWSQKKTISIPEAVTGKIQCVFME